MPIDTSIRVAAAAAEIGAEWTVLTGADSVCYATTQVVSIETGMSPFAGGPTLAIVGPNGHTTLVATNLEVASGSAADAVFAYDGFSMRAERLLENFEDTLRQALEAIGAAGAVAIEPDSLPASVRDVLVARGMRPVDGRSALWRARMIKTPRELGLLHRSASVASAGQIAARDGARPGMTELDLFAIIRASIDSEAGSRTPLAGDLASGVDRTAAAGGWATDRVLQQTDMVLADLAPRVSGYWADSCNTFPLGTPSAAWQRQYDAVTEALEVAEILAGPGVPVNAIDAAVRQHLARKDYFYSHHTGHSIGTSVHEFPRIIPEETTMLEMSMVILLEPGAYMDGVGGVRLERMYEVTDNGLRELTTFQF